MTEITCWDDNCPHNSVNKKGNLPSYRCTKDKITVNEDDEIKNCMLCQDAEGC